MHQPPFILWLQDISIDDSSLVGCKNASLGEMTRELACKGVRIPEGFCITAHAYRHFLREAQLHPVIREALCNLIPNDLCSLTECGQKIRQAFLNAALPDDLRDAIIASYHRLQGDGHLPPEVAVRSSATAEDLPNASFAGQQESYLNVHGVHALLDACKRCFASLYTDRAISYRLDKGFDHAKVALSIGIQRMVRSDLACSGIMFTIDTDSGFADTVVISASYGLGENIVQGSITPDEYCVFKPTLRSGFKPILKKSVGSKEFKLVYDVGGGRMVKNIPVSPGDRARLVLNDDEVLQLARWGCTVEDHYSAKHGHHMPMDIEWAKDGRTGALFILQARPETVQIQRDPDIIESYLLSRRGTVLATGRSIGSKIATGRVRILQNPQQANQFQRGEILVTDKTDPDWQPVMKRAAAIITHRGGRTCHAAIVSRELGVPAIVGVEHGAEGLRNGQLVTVSCAEGDTGYVYDGLLPFEIRQTNLKSLPRPKTRVMMNLANPEEAFSLSFLPNDGVGLARMEFIISQQIGIHPLALVKFDRLTDCAARAEIARITAAYNDKPAFFVDCLAQGIATLAAAFFPKDVILRLSDFKSDDYATLIGGEMFEPKEQNPMLGFRGACRYTHPLYREGFSLECRAVKKVREDMGFTNLKLMVPFCRTIQEAVGVQAELTSHGLRRGENGLELHMTCEVPANVILAQEFCGLFDGFSIGSNDLTQLILGVDRDSEIVAPIFDERNEAVKRAISRMIRICREEGRNIGICGQAPSDYPDFTRFLVEQGIQSISLSPDSILKTTLVILDQEQETVA